MEIETEMDTMKQVSKSVLATTTTMTTKPANSTTHKPILPSDFDQAAVYRMALVVGVLFTIIFLYFICKIVK